MNNGSKEVKDHQQRVLRRLVEIMQRPENTECMDCTSPNPSWASINIGIFVCIRCSGLHRQLGVQVSRVKSCTMDLWEEDQVDLMDKMGNRRAKLIYEGTMPASYMKPGPRAATSLMLQLIMDKYKNRKYYRAPESIPRAVLDGLVDPTKTSRKNSYSVTMTCDHGTSTNNNSNGHSKGISGYDAARLTCYLDEKKKQSVIRWLQGTTIEKAAAADGSSANPTPTPIPANATPATTTTTTTTTTTNNTKTNTKNNYNTSVVNSNHNQHHNNNNNNNNNSSGTPTAKPRLATQDVAKSPGAAATNLRLSQLSNAPSTPMERMTAPPEDYHSFHASGRPTPAPPTGPRPSFHRDPNEYVKADSPALATFTPQRVTVPSSQTNRRTTTTDAEDDLYTYRSANASFSRLVPTRENSIARAPSWLRSSPVVGPQPNPLQQQQPQQQQPSLSPMASWHHADNVLSERLRPPSLHPSESPLDMGPSLPELQGSESRAHYTEPELLVPARTQESQTRSGRSPSAPLFSPSFE